MKINRGTTCLFDMDIFVAVLVELLTEAHFELERFRERQSCLLGELGVPSW